MALEQYVDDARVQISFFASVRRNKVANITREIKKMTMKKNIKDEERRIS